MKEIPDALKFLWGLIVDELFTPIGRVNFIFILIMVFLYITNKNSFIEELEKLKILDIKFQPQLVEKYFAHSFYFNMGFIIFICIVGIISLIFVYKAYSKDSNFKKLNSEKKKKSKS